MTKVTSMVEVAPGLRLVRRGAVVLVNGLMVTLIFLAWANDDPVPAQGRPVLALVVACLLATLASWRWAQLGGWLTLSGATLLAVAVIYSGVVTGLGWTGAAVGILIYAAPYACLGGLALWEAGVAARTR